MRQSKPAENSASLPILNAVEEIRLEVGEWFAKSESRTQRGNEVETIRFQGRSTDLAIHLARGHLRTAFSWSDDFSSSRNSARLFLFAPSGAVF